jgi:tetratricopeptide (TPR) repeat protein
VRGWIHLVRVAGAATEFDEATAALKQAELLLARLREEEGVDPDALADLDSELGLNAGTMEITRGDYPEACARFEGALAIGENGSGSHERKAALLNNLGVAYGMRGEHDRARVYFARAGAAKLELFGPAHPDVATCLLNEGVSLNQIGEHGRARELFLEVIAIRTAAFGPEHPELATAYASLATAQSALGNREEALALYQRVLAIREPSLGVDHPSTAITRNNLADTLLALGRAAEARPYVEDSLAHLQRRLGPEHPMVAYPLHTLGQVRLALGEPAAAAAALESAIELREGQSIDPHDLALTRFALARVLRAHEVLRGPGRDRDALVELEAWLALP